jgi:hypothetical protein
VKFRNYCNGFRHCDAVAALFVEASLAESDQEVEATFIHSAGASFSDEC